MKSTNESHFCDDQNVGSQISTIARMSMWPKWIDCPAIPLNRKPLNRTGSGRKNMSSDLDILCV